MAALAALAQTAAPLEAAARRGTSSHSARASEALLRLLADGRSLFEAGASRAQAKAFFETAFCAHRVRHEGDAGLVTGYYEPVLAGRLTPSDAFPFPVYRRPPDLENLVSESERGAMAHGLTHARRTAEGLVPYFTREEIEQGALHGQGLELLYLADPVDCFFMHVQGSGLIVLEDGTRVRITYDGKNGHPYTSVGRYLIDQGALLSADVTLQSIKVWLSEDRVRGRHAMWQNRSFVFFRALEGDEALSALGAEHIPLSEGRSLAVDTAFHALGTPVFVSAPSLGSGFLHLMIANDVGSAIRGPERGDIYYGSGAEAGALAGVTKHAASFHVLLPRHAAAQ